MTDLAAAIKEIGQTFDEYKKTNDERMLRMEKGQSTADLDAKLARMDAVLSEQGRLKADLESLQLKFQRPGASSGAARSEASEHRGKLLDFMRKGDDAGLRDLERRALAGYSDPDGGYFMAEEMETAIDRVLGAEVAMRRLATVRPIGARSYKKAVVTSGASFGWQGESGTGGETGTPKSVELEFVPGKIYAEPLATQDSLEDGIFDLEAWLNDELALAFAEGEASAFITGNGVNKPRGLLSYDAVANASYEWGKLGYTVSGGASGFASSNPSDKLIDLIHSLKRGYRQGAAFMMNDLTLASIRKFKDGQNNYLWQPGLQAGVADTLLGYKVEVDDYMPDVGADAFPIAFGDFRRGYLIVDRRGITTIRDNITQKGWVKFYTTRRVGGGVQNFEAIKLMKIGT